MILEGVEVPASPDFPDSADTLVESDGVGEVDVDVAIIVSTWLPDWALNCVRPLVVIVFPPVSEEDDTEMPRG